MKAIATAWFHHFDMRSMSPVNTSVVQNVDVKFPSDINRKLMRTAIAGEGNYEEEFKTLLEYNPGRWDDISVGVKEQIGKAFPENVDIANACKIVVQFLEVIKDYYVMKDFFGQKLVHLSVKILHVSSIEIELDCSDNE